MRASERYKPFMEARDRRMAQHESRQDAKETVGPPTATERPGTGTGVGDERRSASGGDAAGPARGFLPNGEPDKPGNPEYQDDNSEEQPDDVDIEEEQHAEHNEEDEPNQAFKRSGQDVDQDPHNGGVSEDTHRPKKYFRVSAVSQREGSLPERCKTSPIQVVMRTVSR